MSSHFNDLPLYDIAVIGGGINGVGIANDAAGRGLSVFLCEKDDFASHTSSASSKLIHGGLRYLEHFEFRLVPNVKFLWRKLRILSVLYVLSCRIAHIYGQRG